MSTRLRLGNGILGRGPAIGTQIGVVWELLPHHDSGDRPKTVDQQCMALRGVMSTADPRMILLCRSASSG